MVKKIGGRLVDKRGSFSEQLLRWYQDNKRDLPWRGERDPYKVWVSEIILQQTRVTQGMGYYHRFIERFPDVYSLARAPQSEVLNIWKGLGYYSRARHLHAAAQEVVGMGSLPQSYSTWLALKGVGKYTAAAIASFCYQESTPVLDGNVKRVLSRLHELSEDIQSSACEKKMYQLLDDKISSRYPGDFNQAMMELGALVCLPKKPLCLTCPVQYCCKAFTTGRQHFYPFRKKKVYTKERFIDYFLLLDRRQKKFFLHQREEKDIWKGLYQLPKFEYEDRFPEYSSVCTSFFDKYGVQPKLFLNGKKPIVVHKLTHQKLHIRFSIATYSHKKVQGLDDHFKVLLTNFEKYPFPIVIVRFLRAALPGLITEYS